MEINEIYAQYCRFWDMFKAIPKYRNRRACSFNQWKARDDAAREAMLDHLKTGEPEWFKTIRYLGQDHASRLGSLQWFVWRLYTGRCVETQPRHPVRNEF